MSFFLVDDAFHSHEKVRALLESSRQDKRGIRYVAGFLWTLAGSMVARKPKRKRDGVITLAQARMLLNCDQRTAKDACDALVEVALWDRHGDAYQFHNWDYWKDPKGADRQTNVGRTSDEGRTEVGQRSDRGRTEVGDGSSMNPATYDTSLVSSPIPYHTTPLSLERAREEVAKANAMEIERMRASAADAPTPTMQVESPQIEHWAAWFRAEYESTFRTRRGFGMQPIYTSKIHPATFAKDFAQVLEAFGEPEKFEDRAKELLRMWFTSEFGERSKYRWEAFNTAWRDFIPNTPLASEEAFQ